MLKTPELMNCVPATMLNAIASCVQLGLEFNSPLQHAHLIPYKNRKAGVTECQLVIGYKGLIELARRSGNIKTIEARLIYSDEEFEVEYGLDPKLVHKPNLMSAFKNKMGLRSDSDIIGAYAVAHFLEGGYQFEVMSRAEIDKIKESSKAKFGPWIDYYSEMARKTVLRRLCKFLPLTPELAQAVDLDDKSDVSNSAPTQVFVDDVPLFAEVKEKPTDKGDEILDNIK